MASNLPARGMLGRNLRRGAFLLNRSLITRPLKQLLQIPIQASLRKEALPAAKRRFRDELSILKRDRSTKRFCVFCDQEVRAWVPYFIRTSDLSDFLIRAEFTGSNMERHGCPHCRSNDRERHLRLYLDALDIFKIFQRSHVLHIAPEAMLTKLIESYGPSRYIRGDLCPYVKY
jgi:hypothetical protein